MSSRRVRHISLAVAALILGSCGSDSQPADVDTQAATAAGGEAAAGEGAVAVAPGPLRGASTAVESSGVWVIGGLTGSSERWEPSPLATLYDRNGAPVQSYELPLPEGQFIAYSTVDHIGDADVIVGSACVVPISEIAGCVSPVTPVFYRLVDGEAVALPVPADLASVLGTDPGDGTVYSRGTVGDRILVIRKIGDGPIPTFTSKNGWWLLNPVTGEAEPVEPQEGTLTPESVCAIDNQIYAAVPSFDEQYNLRGMEVTVSDDGGKTSRVLADLDTELRSTGISGGTLVCLTEAIVVELSAAPVEVAVLDRETGDLVGGETSQIPNPAYLVPSADGASVIATTTHIESSEGAVVGTDQMQVDFFEISGTGVSKVGTQSAPIGSFIVGARVGDRLVDVAALKADPSGSEPLREIES